MSEFPYLNFLFGVNFDRAYADVKWAYERKEEDIRCVEVGTWREDR